MRVGLPNAQRRQLVGAAVAIVLNVTPRPATAKAGNIELGGVTYTPAAMILQLAEQTAAMEGIMRQSAKEIQANMTLQQREYAGQTNQGPGVVGRNDMVRSIDTMITNSKLETIPNSGEAVGTLRAVQFTAKSSKGPLSIDEYVSMARLYSAARDELRRAFEAMSAEEQAEGRAIVRRLRAQDDARMRQMEAEEQRLRALREQSLAGSGARTEPPPPPKAYKEDAQARAAMQKALYGK